MVQLRINLKFAIFIFQFSMLLPPMKIIEKCKLKIAN